MSVHYTAMEPICDDCGWAAPLFGTRETHAGEWWFLCERCAAIWDAEERLAGMSCEEVRDMLAEAEENK
jgi:hypothetical protein